VAFAINIALRGAQAVRSTMIAIRDTIIGSAQAEERLERAAVRAEKAQRKLASAAKDTERALAGASRAAARGDGIGIGHIPLANNGPIAFDPRARQDRAAQIRHHILRQLATQGASDQAAAQASAAGGAARPRGGRFAQALSRIGGAGGAVLGRIGGALGAPTPGLIALGLGAVAGGLALRGFVSHVEHAAQAAGELAKSTIELRNATHEIGKQRNAEAIGVAKGARSSILTLAGAGGDALARGQALAGQVGPGGLEAAAKLQQHNLFSGRSSAALQAAVGTGRITPEQFAETLTKHRGLLGGSSTAEGLASAVIRASGGGRVDVGAVNNNLAGNAFARQFSTVDSLEGSNLNAQLQAFIGRSGIFSELNSERGRILGGPDAEARIQAFKVSQDQLEVLNRMAAQEGEFYGRFKEFLYRFGFSEGSYSGQSGRAATSSGLGG